MIGDILAFFTPGPLELIIILVLALILFAVPIALIVLVVVYVSKGRKEREKLHQKIDELSDELKRTHEQLKGAKKGDS